MTAKDANMAGLVLKSQAIASGVFNYIYKVEKFGHFFKPEN